MISIWLYLFMNKAAAAVSAHAWTKVASAPRSTPTLVEKWLPIG
jgi:hypothetical protein